MDPLMFLRPMPAEPSPPCLLAEAAGTEAHDVMDRLPRILCVVYGFGELLYDNDGVAKVIRAGGQRSVLPLWVACPYLSGVSSAYRPAADQSPQTVPPPMPEITGGEIDQASASDVANSSSYDHCHMRTRKRGPRCEAARRAST